MCIYLYVYVSMGAYLCICVYLHVSVHYVNMHAYMCVCVCIYVFVYRYTCIYISDDHYTLQPGDEALSPKRHIEKECKCQFAWVLSQVLQHCWRQLF